MSFTLLSAKSLYEWILNFNIDIKDLLIRDDDSLKISRNMQNFGVPCISRFSSRLPGNYRLYFQRVAYTYVRNGITDYAETASAYGQYFRAY